MTNASTTMATPPPKVMEGDDGWLYLDHDGNDSVGQYTGRVKLSAAAEHSWRVHFDRIVALRAELGFRFVQLFAPSKESVYEAWYPHRARRAAERPIETVLSLAPKDVPVLYPCAELAPRPGRADTYDKGDTHWNHLGAAIAAELAVRTVGRDMPDPLSFGYRTRPRYGDLDSKIPGRPAGDVLELSRRNTDVTVEFDSELNNRGRVVVMHNPKAPEGSVVIFGDSFANRLRLPLNSAFRRMVFVHANTVDAGFLRLERPDVVIAEMTERFVIQPPHDPESFRLVDLLRLKLEKEPESETARLRALYEARLDGPEARIASLFLQALDHGHPATP
ncbi:SGNH hydrolase-like domain-containing protein, acetyltransferase AlgX [Roseomonas rosea]|uniref:SGNH hydrolase-like domain-containing protein, acetyltransferase AlgX n=1 Tax=Muricoccus roseus TaxID=198092 RepID=A0A1M6L8E7_9PROT|nr:hypothetical protein [Roseomonas rosea]SHJ67456.1 SGNH hydrolase-like domain-containing protein, acetyltransferase AlgX [Roseomonas rosea]